MAKKKIWPKVLGGLTALGIIGGLAYAFSAGKNLYYYMTREAYDKAKELPDDSQIVVVAFHPEAMLADHVRSKLEELAKQHGDVNFIAVSDEIGQEIGMDFEGWGGIAAAPVGRPDDTFTASWGPQTTADQVRDDLLMAIAAVAPKSDTQRDEPPVASFDMAT